MSAEPIYDALAAHLDTLGEAKAPLFLAKAALALAQALGDTDMALSILRECAKNLESR
ncbi:DUF2783 domain-containing protein [Pararhodobacter sp. CCB-MM2]|uniref:DUF2783 domain-containing protein n=1 Tax=Pararhodobacter sp. CCB-MM2 TaxID=1786003 RepID=UPI001111DC49|nr:DUF2783 domain-containing protein [Pararhodobacter sp. CCB-MM2]